jgi:hypothetical protein
MTHTTKSFILVVAAGCLALSNAALADSNGAVDPGHPRVTHVQERQANQQKRIADGIESGALTPGESAKLERQENRIEKRKDADMAAHGGHLTKPEERRLNRQENRVSRHIRDAKHNVRTAPAAETK